MHISSSIPIAVSSAVSHNVDTSHDQLIAHQAGSYSTKQIGEISGVPNQKPINQLPPAPFFSILGM